MNETIAAGAISLGVVVGWMVYHTFTRQERLDAKFLGSIISVMLGASVIGIFQKISGDKSSLPQEVYLYPVGLLIGIVGTAILRFVGSSEQRIEQDQTKLLEAAKQSIVAHISGKGLRMMSFAKLRSDLGKTDRGWSDNFIRRVIAKYPTEIRNATLRGARPGVALMTTEDDEE